MFKIFSMKKFNLLRLFQTTEKAETLPTFMEQLNSDGLIVWDLFYERLEKNVLFSKVITKTRRKFLNVLEINLSDIFVTFGLPNWKKEHNMTIWYLNSKRPWQKQIKANLISDPSNPQQKKSKKIFQRYISNISFLGMNFDKILKKVAISNDNFTKKRNQFIIIRKQNKKIN